MSIQARLEHARRSLLDLSRRNRLINYRPAARTVIALVNESPAAVYRSLVSEEHVLQFADSAAPAPDGRGGGASPDEAAALFDLPEAEPAGPAPDDEVRLRTPLAGPELQRRLLNLARRAESAIQERGANVLYLAMGLLQWSEPGATEQSLAPLLLVPVELTRRSVHRRHAVRLFDDEVVVNPALSELCRTRFRMELPRFDPECEDPTGHFFRAVERVIAPAPGWTATPAMSLGIFSFAKHLMYLDLDDQRWPAERPISGQTLIRAMLLNEPLETTGAAAPAVDLDQALPPLEAMQVLDADSSQLEAIVAARRGSHLLIEGPPGTGKSQTIANLIAEFMAEGRTVLFVAEKAAALEVVQRRLHQVGLGSFVAELHSRKASKRAFADELARAIRAEHAEAPDSSEEAARLQELRLGLNRYVAALHQPVEPLGRSPYQAIGRCAALAAAPEAGVELGDVTAWDGSRLRGAEEAVSGLAAAAARAGDPARHPWRGVRATDLTLAQRQQVARAVEAVAARLEPVAAAARGLRALLGLEGEGTVAECDQLLAASRAILAAPDLALQQMEDPHWDRMPEDAERLLGLCRRVGGLRDALAARWNPSAEEVDWAPALARAQRRGGSPLRFVAPSWWRDRSAMRSHRRPGPAADRAQVARDLADLVALRAARESIRALSARAAQLFGALWRGDESDWAALERAADALVVIRGLVTGRGADAPRLHQLAPPSRRAGLAAGAAELDQGLGALRRAWNELSAPLRLDPPVFIAGGPESGTFARWTERLGPCRETPEALAEWLALARALEAAESAGLGPFAAWAVRRFTEHGPRTWLDAFRRQFHRLWLDAVVRREPSLRDFHGPEREKEIDRFVALDQRWIELTRRRVAAAVAARSAGRRSALSARSGLGLLQAEIRRKRGHKPIRQLLASPAGSVIQTIKPCFMMSPISVAQFLQPGALEFDVVIFDEASQVTPEDALGAVARGAQLVLVGDERQLPPTDFFAVIGASEEPSDDEEAPPGADLESVLALGQTCLPADCRTMLKWHYRSRHDSLINFSNGEFYDGQLRVFPNPQRGRGELGVSLRLIEGAVYARGRGRFNLAEARAVAEAVVDHARRTPHLSLGVGAFSVAQQQAIEDQIERLRLGLDDASEAFFAAGREEPFFVKNLETIQGDERDVILLSVGYGRDESGRVTMNFGPLNRDGGWRRLNVLVTRARMRCVVFTSITAADIRLEPTTPRGVVALRRYLEYAAGGGAVEAPAAASDSSGRELETAVADALRAAGVPIQTGVGCAGYQIDAAVAGAADPSRFVAGVECDGAAYRACATARDRDRIRPLVLQRLGWRLVRVWAMDWLERPQDTAARLGAAIERARAEAAAEAAPVAPSAPAESAAPVAPEVDVVRPEVAAAEEEQDALPPGMVPYRRYSGASRGDREALLRVGEATVRRLMVEIVAAEWPIHREEAMRVAAAQYGARVAGRVRARLDDALRRAVAEGAIALHGDFAFAASGDAPPVRWRGGPGAVTDADLIAIEELVEAARLVVEHDHGVPAADLAAAVVRALGFRRVGPQLGERAQEAVKQALARGTIGEDPSGLCRTDAPPRDRGTV
jgi:DNA polymerase III delta prime subunit